MSQNGDKETNKGMVRLDKRNFSRGRENLERSEAEVECPELNILMGLPDAREIQEIRKKINGHKAVIGQFKDSIINETEEDKKEKIQDRINELELELEAFEEKNQITVVLVRQLTLPEYLGAKKESNDAALNLVEGILNASVNAGLVESETVALFNELPADVQFHLNVIKAGLVDPVLSWTDIVWLGDSFPEVAVRLSTKILSLTHGGSTLKKNS
jgi:hypothetical protein